MSDYDDKLDAGLSAHAELAANLGTSPGFTEGLRQIARTVATEAKAMGRIALDDAIAAAKVLEPIAIEAAKSLIASLIESELKSLAGK